MKNKKQRTTQSRNERIQSQLYDELLYKDKDKPRYIFYNREITNLSRKIFAHSIIKLNDPIIKAYPISVQRELLDEDKYIRIELVNNGITKSITIDLDEQQDIKYNQNTIKLINIYGDKIYITTDTYSLKKILNNTTKAILTKIQQYIKQSNNETELMIAFNLYKKLTEMHDKANTKIKTMYVL